MAKIEIKQLKGFPRAKFDITIAANTKTHHKVAVNQDLMRCQLPPAAIYYRVDSAL
jgi:hypothetical protein